MDPSTWHRWLEVERLPDLKALVYAPLESVGDCHPSVLGVVTTGPGPNAARPGIDVCWDLHRLDPLITCAGHFGVSTKSQGSGGHGTKIRHRIAAEVTVDDYLRRVMYSVCDVLCLQGPSLEAAVDELLVWLDACISTTRGSVLPCVSLHVDGLDSDAPVLFTQLAMLCTQRLEDRGTHTSVSAVRNSLRECFSEVSVASSTRQLLQSAMHDRIRAGFFYSAKTIEQFFEMACHHFADGTTDQLCFVTSLRRLVLPDIPAYEECRLPTYFRACSDEQTALDFACSAVAYVLVKDSHRILLHSEYPLVP